MSKSKARNLADLLGGTGSAEFQGESGIILPDGTTAQRPSPATVGTARYNTDIGKNEVYDSDGWTAIAPPPAVTSVSPTSFDGDAGQTFTISGQKFDTNATVKIVTSGGSESGVASVTRNSSSSLTVVTSQAYTVADEPLSFKVINGTGLSAVLEGVVDCGGIPNWGSASYNLSCYDSMRDGFNHTLDATDPDGQTVTYAVTSGSLPTGMSISGSSITGTPNAVTSDTAYNSTITATDSAGNTSSRNFTITIKAPVEQVFSYTGSLQTLTIPSGLTSLVAHIWGAGGGGGANGSWGAPSVAGCAGAAVGTVDVSNISTLAIVVGGGGQGQDDNSSTGVYGGYGGGGSNLHPSDNRYGGAGGGLSGLFNGSFTHSNSILIAGGGGGGGCARNGSNANRGGAGGGTNGLNGTSYTGGYGGSYAGRGGTQTAGGAVPPSGANAGAGSALQGGQAGGDSGGNYGGAGGGGYYGGSGGTYAEQNDMGGGGGGSGYLHPSLVSNGTLYAGAQTDRQSPGNKTSGYWDGSAGIGGATYTTGGHGRVVLVY